MIGYGHAATMTQHQVDGVVGRARESGLLQDRRRENRMNAGTRAERRRMDREIQKTNPQAGVGKGWRVTSGPRKRRYGVVEPPRRTLEELEAECDAAQERMSR